jgi:sensor c-di-GMP phosphodiesterase-like protein
LAVGLSGVGVLSAVFQRLVAVIVGVVAAAAAMAAFSLWLDGLIDGRGRAEVEHSAQRAVRLAERRLGAVRTTLDDLAARGINDCNGSQVAALQKAAFFSPAVKEIAVVSADGRMICGSSGLIPELQTVVVPSRSDGTDDFMIDVVRVDGRQSMVRVLRRDLGPNALAALIPAALLSTSGSLQVIGRSTHVRIATRDNMTIVEQGPPPAANAEPFVATLRSEHYGLTAVASLPRSALLAEARELRWQATMFGAALLVGAFIVALLLRHRRRDPYSDFEQAIADSEFVPYYQPIVDIRTGRLRGAEVLMRRRKPDGSVQLPSAFIPFAESSGLIVPLMRTLMRRVRDEMGEAIGSRPELRIGFNLAAPHFTDDRIIADVREIFTDGPIPLRQIMFEVTERQPLENLAGARRIIAGLQELGCGVAIDDVGIGHGGLSYILKLGADVIKIDKLFVDAIGSEHDSTTILETLVDLARSMRMGVVAEGVENFEQVLKLRDLGILAAQGYVFSPPLPGKSFAQLLESLAPMPRAEGEVGKRAVA